MTLEQLKQQAQQLMIQRSSLKDQLENIEKLLGQMGFAIQIMEANAKADAKPAEGLGDIDVEVS